MLLLFVEKKLQSLLNKTISHLFIQHNILKNF